MINKSIKETYLRFLNTRHGVDVYHEFKRILYSEDDSLVKILEHQILKSKIIAEKPILKICDIGGGDGDRILRFLEFVFKEYRACVELDFIEQSNIFVAEFRRRRRDTFSETNIYQGLFEEIEFQSHKYDLVLLIHSIFAINNIRAIKKILSSRKPDGKIFVLSNAPKSFLGGLKRIVDEGFDDQRFEIDDLKRSLINMNILFSEIKYSTEWMIKKENMARDVAVILDWISLGQFNHYSEEKKREVFDYFRVNSIEKKGNRYFSEEEEILVIPK